MAKLLYSCSLHWGMINSFAKSFIKKLVSFFIFLLIGINDLYAQTNVNGNWQTLMKAMEPTLKQSEYYGKKIQVFGGSLSIKPESKTAIDIWRKYLGVEVQQCGRGGAGFSRDTSEPIVNLSSDNNLEFKAGYNSIQDLVDAFCNSNYDIYVLWASTNDYTKKVEIGTPNDYTESDGYDESKRTTQCGGINYCIKYLRAKNPQARIVLLGSIKFFGTRSGYDKNPEVGNGIASFYEYIDAMKKCAELQGIEFFNQFDIPGMTLKNSSKYYLDGFHMTNSGYENVAPYQTYFLATGKSYNDITTFSFRSDLAECISAPQSNTILCPVADNTTDSAQIKLSAVDASVTVNDICINREALCIFKNGKLYSGNVCFTSLPVVSLNIDADVIINHEESAPALLKIFSSSEDEYTEAETYHCRVHYRGETANIFEKKSYSIDIVDEENNERDVNIFGIRKDDKWILDAMCIDKSRMRNRVCFDIWNSMNEPPYNDMLRNGTDGRFVEVVLNGKLNGLYCLSDKINRKLLGLKKTDTSDSGETLLKGRLYKCSRADYPTHFLQMPETEMSMNKESWFDFDLKYPDGILTPETWQPLVDVLKFCSLTSTEYEYVRTHWTEYFYESNVVKFSLFIYMIGGCDNMMHNSYLSFRNPNKDKRMLITPWDLDGTMGRDGMGNEIKQPSASFFTFRDTQPFRSFFDNQDESFFSSLQSEWEKQRNGLLSVNSVYTRLNEYATLFNNSGAWARENELWGSKTRTLENTPFDEVSYMTSWYARNYENIVQLFNEYTDIETIKVPQGASGHFYDLMGRRIDKPLRRGIYINNGKKVKY